MLSSASDANWRGHPNQATSAKAERIMTLENAQAVPRDLSSLPAAVNTMLADVNIYLHTGEGDIVGIAKQLAGLLDNIEANPRKFLNAFGGDQALYNDWVSAVNDLAGYIVKVKKATGPVMDFMGMQNAINALTRAVNRYKASFWFL